MSELVTRFRRLSWPQLCSLAVFAVGAGLDVVYHVAPVSLQPALARYLGSDGSNAHLVTFIGMLLILATVLQSAVRPRRRFEEKEVMHRRVPFDS